MLFKKTHNNKTTKHNCNDCFSSTTLMKLKLSLSQCSGIMCRSTAVTNRELCALLEPVHNVMPPILYNKTIPIHLLFHMRIALSQLIERIDLSYHYFHAKNTELSFCEEDYSFLRPITARQAHCSTSVLNLLHKNNFLEAFHELYDTIDDFGYQHKKWRGEYKSISCNEAVLFKLITQEFLFYLNKYIDTFKWNEDLVSSLLNSKQLHCSERYLDYEIYVRSDKELLRNSQTVKYFCIKRDSKNNLIDSFECFGAVNDDNKNAKELIDIFSSLDNLYNFKI